MAEPVSITHEPSRSPSGTNAMDQRPMQARIYGHLRKPACQQNLYLAGSTRSTPWKPRRGLPPATLDRLELGVGQVVVTLSSMTTFSLG